MLKNIFNSAGIAQKNHVMCQEKNVIYYAASTNIMRYENNKITPIIRYGSEITNLKVRDGIILSDRDNYVEHNNAVIFECNDAIQAVNKSRIVKYNGMLCDVKVFCSFDKIYIFCEKCVFYVEQEGTTALDCIIVDESVFLVCGTLDGKILKFTISLAGLLGFDESGRNSFGTDCTHGYEHMYREERKIEKITDIKRMHSYTVKSVKAHEDTVTDIKINESVVLSSSQDKTAKIHDLQTLEHVDTLIGHRDYVYESNFVDNHDEIISAGADNCVIVWEFKDGWKSKVRLGNLMSTPFYSALVINEKLGMLEEEDMERSDRKTEQKNEYFVIVQSYNGGMYRYCNTDLVESVSGHVDKITTLDVKNDFILTGSPDRTVRLYYKLREVARPCIHGHPIRSAVFFNDYIIVGSDESILRVYEKTSGVQKILHDIDLRTSATEPGSDTFGTGTVDEKCEVQQEDAPFVATPSELSLTNEIRKITTPLFLNEHTLQNILCFRERKKIYAQFFANACLASNNKIILCANKSSSLKFSGIFVIVDFVVVQYIAVHNLGIENIEISNSGEYVVAVSRDKSVSFYQILDRSRSHSEKNEYVRKDGKNAIQIDADGSEKVINKILKDSLYYLDFRKRILSHTRKINTASFDDTSTLFATGSKDRNVLIYSVDCLEVIRTLKFEEEVTALRFYRENLFVGLKNGFIKVFTNDGTYTQVYERKIHGKSVNEIKVDGNTIVTVSDDSMMRVFSLDIG
ncbi:hypothetical protein VCUG_00058 [Vavraia culicis subsp. floridensis]|uniref:Elongator complex protein 2 n=1 Tax=Vavraia culicis (isolate floridensis) TaxID=948595 RepID=L2GXV1_VAVCU|nr:uncharacterized protein VCUG_00058 [Vavraia culicis subsp. floridensis]ELA48449.1 hypothetical protein VCUG_00058 [Vavraia culicis subsp. floridensis]